MRFQPPRMNAQPNRILALNGMSTRAVVSMALLIAASAGVPPFLHGAESTAQPAWRSLPLITDGKVDPNWVHVGWGGFVIDEGALRTECEAKGLGLLVYKKERLGHCQIRVVFKAKDGKSNSGVYVRLADGILEQV